jgi:hypothetical protein
MVVMTDDEVLTELTLLHRSSLDIKDAARRIRLERSPEVRDKYKTMYSRLELWSKEFRTKHDVNVGFRLIDLGIISRNGYRWMGDPLTMAYGITASWSAPVPACDPVEAISAAAHVENIETEEQKLENELADIFKND